MSGYQSERRRKERAVCDSEFFFSPKEAGIKVYCILRNISYTGACIQTDYPIEIDDYLALHLEREGDVTVSLRSRVVWQDDHRYGISFLLDTEEEFENISHILNSRIT